MTVGTHPYSRIAGEIFDHVAGLIGAVAASRWMFSGNVALQGAAPIERLKLGRFDEVKRAALDLNTDAI